MSKKNITGDKFIFDTYGQALAKARGIMKLNQGKFADRIGNYQSAVSRWEISNAEPIEIWQEKISHVLKEKQMEITPVAEGWELRFLEGSEKADTAIAEFVNRVLDKNAELSKDDLVLSHKFEKMLDEKISRLLQKIDSSDE